MNDPFDSQSTLPPRAVDGQVAENASGVSGYAIAFVTTLVLAVLTGMLSGMPSLVAIAGLIGIGLFLWFHQPLFFYLGFVWLSCGGSLPWFRGYMENTFVGDWVHAATSLGLLISGLAYMEIASPLYQIWSGDDDTNETQPRPTRQRSRFDKAARAQPFSGAAIPFVIGVIGGTVALALLPLDGIDRSTFRMVSPVVRLMVLFLAISLPAWVIYMLMTLVAWRRLTPKQALLYLLRSFHVEQQREHRLIEKKPKNSRAKTVDKGAS